MKNVKIIDELQIIAELLELICEYPMVNQAMQRVLDLKLELEVLDED